MSSTFRSLKYYNARLFFSGLAVSNVGTWLQMTAMSLLVYRLTGEATAVGVTAAGMLTLAACGSEEGGGGSGSGSTDAFCEEFTTFANFGDESTDERDLDALKATADAAPDEISDEMDQLVEAFERLRSFNPEAASEEELAEFLAIAEGLEEASATVEEFTMENCPDLPADFFGTD